MAALLTSETGNTAKVVKYINECKEMGITVLPPDVNSSDWSFTPDMTAPGVGGIRFGLGAVKNLGQAAVESIRTARNEVGRFRSLYQFAEKVDLGALNRRMIESLIKSGAMDSLGGTRSQLFATLERAMEHGQRSWRDRMSGQAGLFAMPADDASDHEEPLPAVPDWTVQEKLSGEKEMLGFYVTGHPLDQYTEKVRELATHDTSNLEGLEKGADVTLCGILTGVQRRRNKEGKPWAAMHIEDLSGSLEAMVFTTNFERLESSLSEDRAVMVRASVLPEENGPPKISIQEIVPLEVARVPLPSLISIRVWLAQNGDGGADKVKALSELFERKPGSTEVRLRLEKSRDFTVILDISTRVRPDKEFRAEVERICGPEALEVLAG
jgi:DNA polymerase-3 subunit alpha